MSLHQDISELFDSALLDMLKNGREMVTEDGTRERVPISAADLNIIRQRLKDCGITAVATEENPIGNIVAEMKARGMTIHNALPEVSTDDDAASSVG